MENNKKINPLFCDPETGACEIPGELPSGSDLEILAKHKPVRLLYFTDPICSSCWGIEPQLRKLKLEYGQFFDMEYHMGGLLQSWDTYGGRDVNGPESVASHWDEASARYNMPIDGDVWLEDPLDSSFPPSIAFKAAQMQSDEKAVLFLRKMREMLFLEKKNITRWEHLKLAAEHADLDVKQLRNDFEGRAKDAFEEDLAMKNALGVRGFPTIFFTDEEGNRFLVYGSQAYEKYEEALLKLFPQAGKKSYNMDPEMLFHKFRTLTKREFAELSGNSLQDAEEILMNLEFKKEIKKFPSKNGDLWVKIENDGK